VNLNAGEKRLVPARWTAASPDTHASRVTVDPFGLAYGNNHANDVEARAIVLGQPVIGALPVPLPGAARSVISGQTRAPGPGGFQRSARIARPTRRTPQEPPGAAR